MKKKRTSQKKNYKSVFQLFHFVTRTFLIIVLCIMVVFSLCFFVYLGDVFINSSNNKSPLFGAYIIASPSMSPSIKTKDAIIIKRVDHDNYKVGDIITFVSSDINYQGYLITHRIIEKDSVSEQFSYYRTKGDNNPIMGSSSLVSTNSIYGKVLFKIPRVGYIQEFLSKPTNYYLILLVTAVIFICFDVVRIMIAINRKNFG